MSFKSKRVYIWSITLCFVFLIAYTLFESQDVESSEQPLTVEQQYPTVFVHAIRAPIIRSEPCLNASKTIMDGDRKSWRST